MFDHSFSSLSCSLTSNHSPVSVPSYLHIHLAPNLHPLWVLIIKRTAIQSLLLTNISRQERLHGILSVELRNQIVKLDTVDKTQTFAYEEVVTAAASYCQTRTS